MTRQDYYQKVINSFTPEWINSEWLKFKDKRAAFSPKALGKEIVSLELRLHPLFKLVINYQDMKSNELDFSKIPERCLADLELMYLGRDLMLLEEEMALRGNKLIKDLKQAGNYSNHRFTLLTAAAFKKEGYEIEFVPESSKEKRADLFVKREYDFYVECKQRNQHASDIKRFELLALLSEKVFSALDLLRYNTISLKIDIIDEKQINETQMLEDLTSRIARGNFSVIQNNAYTITFFNLNQQPEVRNLLLSAGHLRGKIVFTVADDYFFSSSVSGNAILVNKSVGNSIPRNLYSLLQDASLKQKNGGKLLVYVDVGRGINDWAETLARSLKDGLEKNQDQYPNIDGFVVMQSPFKILPSRNIVTQPNVFVVGRRSKIGTDPETLSLPGTQGETGLDNYFKLS